MPTAMGLGDWNSAPGTQFTACSTGASETHRLNTHQQATPAVRSRRRLSGSGWDGRSSVDMEPRGQVGSVLSCRVPGFRTAAGDSGGALGVPDIVCSTPHGRAMLPPVRDTGPTRPGHPGRDTWAPTSSSAPPSSSGTQSGGGVSTVAEGALAC